MLLSFCRGKSCLTNVFNYFTDSELTIKIVLLSAVHLNFQKADRRCLMVPLIETKLPLGKGGDLCKS